MGTLPLLQMILDRTERPVLAAGGILNRRGLAAVLAAGAHGAWVGTAFLGCAEAEMSPSARARLIGETETGYGRVFDVAQELAWPREFGGRALVNDFFEEWVGREEDMDDSARLRHQEARRSADFDVAHSFMRARESLRWPASSLRRKSSGSSRAHSVREAPSTGVLATDTGSSHLMRRGLRARQIAQDFLGSSLRLARLNISGMVASRVNGHGRAGIPDARSVTMTGRGAQRLCRCECVR